MKKKLTALVLASAMALGAGAFLAGCTQPEPEHTKHYDVDADGVCDVCSVDMEGHEHIYSKKWTYDNEYHWHKATCAHENEISGKEAHDYDSMGICKDCKMFDPTPVAPIGSVYHFEAEHAVLDDAQSPTNSTMVIEVNKHEFTESGKTDGPLVSNVGYFGGGYAGHTITWKFNSATAVENVKLKLRMASAVGSWEAQKITAIELGTDGAPTLAVNGTAVSLAGNTLKGLGGLSQADMQNGVAYHNFTEVEITINIVAGENTVVLTSGSNGCNVDKIMITTDAQLTFTRTNNLQRPGSH